jgi:hypothetical protein
VVRETFDKQFGKESFTIDSNGKPGPVPDKVVPLHKVAYDELRPTKLKAVKSEEHTKLLQCVSNHFQEMHNPIFHKRLLLKAILPKDSANLLYHAHIESSWSTESNESIKNRFDRIFQSGVVTLDVDWGVPMLDMNKVVSIAEIATQQLSKETGDRANKMKINHIIDKARSAEKEIKNLCNPYYQMHIMLGVYYPCGTNVGGQWPNAFWEDCDKDETFPVPEDFFHRLHNRMMGLPMDKTMLLEMLVRSTLKDAIEQATVDKTYVRKVLCIGIKAKVADLNAKIFCSREDVDSVKALYNHFWKKGNKGSRCQWRPDTCGTHLALCV